MHTARGGVFRPVPVYIYSFSLPVVQQLVALEGFMSCMYVDTYVKCTFCTRYRIIVIEYCNRFIQQFIWYSFILVRIA